MNQSIKLGFSILCLDDFSLYFFDLFTNESRDFTHLCRGETSSNFCDMFLIESLDFTKLHQIENSSYKVSQNRCNPLVWLWFITETNTMAVIWNTSCKKKILLVRHIKSIPFKIVIISVSRIWNLFFFKFLVSVINHFHIKELHLFWDSFEWFCLQISSDTKYFFLCCPRHLIED